MAAPVNGPGAASETVLFDIPSQSLGPALEAYARIAGREVLYNGALAVGQRSSTVEGLYTPREALLGLLAGTGLSAEFKDAGFFVLVPSPPVAPPPRAGSTVQPPAVLRYYGTLQARLRAAFCREAVVRPGRYRIAARLWIGPAGEVQREQRLASTGDAALDRQVDETLRGLTLGEPPPGFAQPITIAILPNAPGVRRDCDGDDARSLP